MHRSKLTPVVPLFTVVLAACASAEANNRFVEGDCGTVHGAEVCTWARVSGTDVTELGATIPLAMVEQAPAHVEMHGPPQAIAKIALPEEARAATGLEFMDVFWEPHGHPPGPYLYPHFDFHFYNISMPEAQAIDCSETRKPEALPAGYALPDFEHPEMGTIVGLCVPAMGMHALPASELESTEPFTATMLVGYYEGEPVFIEPMITRDLLLRRASFELDVPHVDLPQGVRYPTRFHAEYDSEIDAYQFVLSGF
jgi:hypothetical protein